MSQPSPTDSPTWDKDVLPLFKAPSWVAASDRVQVATKWKAIMLTFNLDLDDPSEVKTSAAALYYELSSKKMPLSSDMSEAWPDAALATFQKWANTGFRITVSDHIINQIIIQSPPTSTLVPTPTPQGSSSRCPFSPSTPGATTSVVAPPINLQPTWDDTVRDLFAKPY